MRAMGLDVRIISNVYQVESKIKWIERNLGKEGWTERTIFTNDVNIIETNYLIHSDPFAYYYNKNVGIPCHTKIPENNEKLLILFDKSFNSQKAVQIKLKSNKSLFFDPNTRRMKNWSVWKTSLNLGFIIFLINFFIF